jgi:hypothetical protein
MMVPARMATATCHGQSLRRYVDNSDYASTTSVISVTKLDWYSDPQRHCECVELLAVCAAIILAAATGDYEAMIEVKPDRGIAVPHFEVKVVRARGPLICNEAPEELSANARPRPVGMNGD